MSLIKRSPDLLFGSCQSIFSRALNQDNRYELETRQIERLEEEIQHLIQAGFTWKDAYTQCTLQNMLVEFSRGRIFNRKLCEDALVSTDWTQDVTNEIARVLQRLESGDHDAVTSESEAERDFDLLNSNKRDEIVQVHKYFDRSTGQLKRDPYFEDNVYDDQDESPTPYSLFYPQNSLPAVYKDKDAYQFYNNDDRSSYMPDLDPSRDLSETNALAPFLGRDTSDNFKDAVDEYDDTGERVIGVTVMFPVKIG